MVQPVTCNSKATARIGMKLTSTGEKTCLVSVVLTKPLAAKRSPRHQFEHPVRLNEGGGQFRVFRQQALLTLVCCGLPGRLLRNFARVKMQAPSKTCLQGELQPLQF